MIDLPSNVLSMIIFFNNEKDLFSFVDDIRSKSLNRKDIIDLREIEFFDKNTLSILKDDYSNIPEKINGAVWIEQEYNVDVEDEILVRIEELILKNNGENKSIWYAFNEKERKKFKEFRHKIALKVNDIISERGLTKVGTDTAVPDNKFLAFYEFTINLIENHDLEYVVYGHIGNSHLHFNMLPRSKTELVLCKKLYGKICSKSLEFDGTISAEHGIGKLKRDYLTEMYGESNIIKMAKLKKTLDPNKILNVGNIFSEKYLSMV